MNRKPKFCPSLMCTKIEDLADNINELAAVGVDRFHIDIMDGVFVSNFALGLHDAEAICRLSPIKTEAHLMIVDPSKYVQKFADLGVDIIYVHPEADYHPSATLQKIISAGAEPGIVINPDVSVETVKELLHLAKYVLCMSVTPGYAGQVFLPFIEKKLTSLIQLKEEYQFELGLDGGCTYENIKYYFDKGVDSFVLGTNTLFREDGSYKESMNRLYALLESADGIKKSKKTKIKMLVMDIDGTLTDGKIYMGGGGEVQKAFNIKDGYAINELLPQHDIIPVWITGRKSEITLQRAKELGVTLVFQGVKDKLKLLIELADKHSITPDEIAYIGDDIIDLECMRYVGCSGCPSDAAPDAREASRFIAKSKAGEGAVREFVEWIIRKGDRC